MMGAQLCVAREQHALGESLLERTIELYPRFEEAHAELIGLYSQSGPLRDPDKFSQSIIALRRVAPSSKTIRWLRAQELLRSGQYNRAEQELLSLASERLTRPVVDMLVTLWIRTGSPERAEQWLLEQRQMSPSDPLFVSKLAEVYSQSDRAQEGADLLEAWLERRPGEMAISRQLESLYRTQLDNHARANALAQRRLERAPESPQRSLELAALYRTNRELSSSLRALEELLALRPTMSPGQWNQLYQESLLLAQGALNGDLDEGARVARFFGIVLDQAASPPDELHRIHVMLLLDTEAGVDDVLASIIRSHEANPATSSNLFDIATTLYYQRNDMGSAITIASRAMAQLDSPSQTLVSTLMQACYFELDIDNALQAVRAAERGGYARELTTIDQRNINITVDEQAASELLYNFGVWFAVNGRIEESHRIYRAALEYNPDHVMANNNLGYSLADLDMSIDEAHRLILRAYSLDSTQGSITDSLGWVRYKLGILDDTLDEQGVVTQEGAITLLTRATTMDGARDDPIVHDHLADALWVSGRVDEARKHWTTAASFLDTIPQLDPDRANPGELFLQEESRRLRESIRLKLDALDNSQAPPVASSAATRDDDPSGM
ncbi:MAG: tetratricopeptide repeat protein, partial [Phycisphaerales bacterium JB043]